MADKRKQIVLNEILHLIGSIKEHADDLEWNNHIPQIELEFISSKIAKLYEKSIVLNFLNTFEDDFLTSNKNESTLVNNTIDIKEVTNAEAYIQERSTEPISATSQEATIVISEEPNKISISEEKHQLTESVLAENLETMDVSTDVSSVSLTETTISAFQQPESIVEDTVEIKSVQFSNPLLKKIADPKRPPIANLKSAISINQRLQFINNLFKGNAELMNQSIDELNNLTSLDEASIKLSELTIKMGWDKEYELYLGFKELVERRYS
jgi:hypothetical protein